MLRPLRPALVLLALTACSPKTPEYATPHDFFKVLGLEEACKPAQTYCMQFTSTTPEMVFKVTKLPKKLWTASPNPYGDVAYTLKQREVSLFISVPVDGEHNITASTKD